MDIMKGTKTVSLIAAFSILLAGLVTLVSPNLNADLREVPTSEKLAIVSQAASPCAEYALQKSYA